MPAATTTTPTGRILGEPAEVYHGPHDKPAFGSGAINMWLRDPDQFYRVYVAKLGDRPDLGRVGLIGNAVEEVLLENRDRTALSTFKTTTAAGFAKEQQEQPDKLLVTEAEKREILELVVAGASDRDFLHCAEAGQSQVTYRHDMGPFYLQARIDLEVIPGEIPERLCDDLQIDPVAVDRLLVDLKTCATFYGRGRFDKAALQFGYPVQEALYLHVIRAVEGLAAAQLPFWFFAISKDSLEPRWYRFLDASDTVADRVTGAIGELLHRFRSDDWSEFRARTRTVFVPDWYIKKDE